MHPTEGWPPPAIEKTNGLAFAGPDRSGDCTRQPKRTATAAAKQAKWARVLRAFIDRGAEGYNRFQAERELHDHCLPTTISQLEARGVRIERRMETVPGYMGAPTDCARYWLAPESRQHARELLGLPMDTAEPSARSATSEAAQ